MGVDQFLKVEGQKERCPPRNAAEDTPNTRKELRDGTRSVRSKRKDRIYEERVPFECLVAGDDDRARRFSERTLRHVMSNPKYRRNLIESNEGRTQINSGSVACD